MVKITYEPYTELVIKECVKVTSVDELARLAVLAGPAVMQPTPLQWAEGVLFLSSAIPPENDRLIDELLKGRIYISSVYYVEMLKYQNLIETKERIQVPVLDVSSNPTFTALAKWLKERN